MLWQERLYDLWARVDEKLNAQGHPFDELIAYHEEAAQRIGAYAEKINSDLERERAQVFARRAQAIQTAKENGFQGYT